MHVLRTALREAGFEGQDGEWTVTLSKRTRRSISLENGLRRALLGLLPLPAPFGPMIFGRLERSLNKEKYYGHHARV